MDTEQLKKRILTSIYAGQSLDSQQEILVEFRKAGGSQKEAYYALEEVRKLRDDDWFEDVMVDILSLVYGWCHPNRWIWDTYFEDNPANYEDTDS